MAVRINFLGIRQKRQQTDWHAMTDQELIRLYQQRQQLDIIGFLMERHKSLIISRTLNELSEEETRDFVADLFLKLKEKLLRTQEIVHFKAWLRRTISNALIDRGRKLQREKTYQEKSIAAPKESEAAIDARMVLSLDQGKLLDALDQLKPIHRLYVVQHFFYGKQNQEIAKEFNLSINQVRGARERALNKLRSWLQEDFGQYLSD